MGGRRIALISVEFAVAVLLLAALFVASDISVRAVVEVVYAVFGWPLLGIVILCGLQVLASAIKWRHVLDQHPQHVRQPLRFYLFHTAYGMLLGQVVPVQMGTAASRAVALKLHDEHRPLLTGTVTSVYEQAFDLAIPFALLPASVIALAFDWSPLAWCTAAATGVIALPVLLATARLASERHRKPSSLVKNPELWLCRGI